MIVKEQYTRKDGVMLYRTYSDTDHLIKKVADGVIYGDAIDVAENEEYEEIDGYVELEGPESYDEIIKVTEEASVITRKINRIHLTNNEALSVKNLYPRWEDKIGKTIEAGFITLYDGNLWKARQTHTALEVYPPSLNTASLYEVIVEEHEGTMEDPIPYTPPMEIYEDKYYTQYDVLYKCTRSSGVALTHDLFDLRGLYVELIER
jgi:hypothetical protein